MSGFSNDNILENETIQYIIWKLCSDDTKNKFNNVKPVTREDYYQLLNIPEVQHNLKSLLENFENKISEAQSNDSILQNTDFNLLIQTTKHLKQLMSNILLDNQNTFKFGLAKTTNLISSSKISTSLTHLFRKMPTNCNTDIFLTKDYSDKISVKETHNVYSSDRNSVKETCTDISSDKISAKESLNEINGSLSLESTNKSLIIEELPSVKYGKVNLKNQKLREDLMKFYERSSDEIIFGNSDSLESSLTLFNEYAKKKVEELNAKKTQFKSLNKIFESHNYKSFSDTESVIDEISILCSEYLYGMLTRELILTLNSNLDYPKYIPTKYRKKLNQQVNYKIKTDSTLEDKYINVHHLEKSPTEYDVIKMKNDRNNPMADPLKNDYRRESSGLSAEIDDIYEISEIKPVTNSKKLNDNALGKIASRFTYKTTCADSQPSYDDSKTKSVKPNESSNEPNGNSPPTKSLKKSDNSDKYIGNKITSCYKQNDNTLQSGFTIPSTQNEVTQTDQLHKLYYKKNKLTEKMLEMLNSDDMTSDPNKVNSLILENQKLKLILTKMSGKTPFGESSYEKYTEKHDKIFEHFDNSQTDHSYIQNSKKKSDLSFPESKTSKYNSPNISHRSTSYHSVNNLEVSRSESWQPGTIIETTMHTTQSSKENVRIPIESRSRENNFIIENDISNQTENGKNKEISILSAHNNLLLKNDEKYQYSKFQNISIKTVSTETIQSLNTQTKFTNISNEYYKTNSFEESSSTNDPCIHEATSVQYTSNSQWPLNIIHYSIKNDDEYVDINDKTKTVNFPNDFPFETFSNKIINEYNNDENKKLFQPNCPILNLSKLINVSSSSDEFLNFKTMNPKILPSNAFTSNYFKMAASDHDLKCEKRHISTNFLKSFSFKKSSCTEEYNSTNITTNAANNKSLSDFSFDSSTPVSDLYSTRKSSGALQIKKGEPLGQINKDNLSKDLRSHLQRIASNFVEFKKLEKLNDDKLDLEKEVVTGKPPLKNVAGTPDTEIMERVTKFKLVIPSEDQKDKEGSDKILLSGERKAIEENMSYVPTTIRDSMKEVTDNSTDLTSENTDIFYNHPPQLLQSNPLNNNTDELKVYSSNPIQQEACSSQDDNNIHTCPSCLLPDDSTHLECSEEIEIVTSAKVISYDEKGQRKNYCENITKTKSKHDIYHCHTICDNKDSSKFDSVNNISLINSLRTDPKCYPYRICKDNPKNSFYNAYEQFLSCHIKAFKELGNKLKDNINNLFCKINDDNLTRQTLDIIRLCCNQYWNMCNNLRNHPFFQKLNSLKINMTKIFIQMKNNHYLLFLHLTTIFDYFNQASEILNVNLLPRKMRKCAYTLRIRYQHFLSVNQKEILIQYLYVSNTNEDCVNMFKSNLKDRRIWKLEQKCHCRTYLLNPSHPEAAKQPPYFVTVEVVFDPLLGNHRGFMSAIQRIFNRDLNSSSLQMGPTIIKNGLGKLEKCSYGKMCLTNHKSRESLKSVLDKGHMEIDFHLFYKMNNDQCLKNCKSISNLPTLGVTRDTKYILPKTCQNMISKMPSGNS